MLQRWHHAPRWVVGAVVGAVFTVLYGSFTWLTTEGSLLATVVGAVVAGTLFGVVMGRLSGRLRPRWSVGAAAVSPSEHRVGLRAARGGPVPSDPRSREVAADVLRHRLAHARRWRTLELAGFAAFVVLYVVMALFSSPWWWFAVALFAGFLAMAARQHPARLSRRLDELTTPG